MRDRFVSLFGAIVALLALVILTSHPVRAFGAGPDDALIPDNQPATIAAHAEAWYAFSYRGDRSPITIRLDSNESPSIPFAVYTTEQANAWQRGDRVNPIGRGTPRSDTQLSWVGSFNHGGTYYVAVRNESGATLRYQLAIDGVSVQTRSVAAAPPNSANGGGGGTPPPGSSAVGQSSYHFDLPEKMGMPGVSVVLPPVPSVCTPPSSIGSAVYATIRLCPNSVYPPINLVGSNLALYGDPGRTAIIQSRGRAFAVTAQGANISIVGVTIHGETFVGDVGAWLCVFELCGYGDGNAHRTVHGGIAYGGGILLQAPGSTVADSYILGGTVGIAAVKGANYRVVNNRIESVSGWGSYNVETVNSYFVGNTFRYVNRDCVAPDGTYYSQGCETAAWLCIGCTGNYIASNVCEHSGNCYYASGDGGRPSNDNLLFSNRCVAAPNNCFEITFSFGNLLEDNSAEKDPNSGENCNFPFWIGGSTIRFGRSNNWACAVSSERAYKLSSDSTAQTTMITGR